jgi:eukaryotic-like serine/threonine-protein kinase
VRLGDGWGLALSPDEKWVLALQQSEASHFVLLPTGPGESKHLKSGKVVPFPNARWFPDGKRILYVGAEAGRGPQLFVQDLAGGAPRVVTPVILGGAFAISPDGKELAVGPDSQITIYPAAGGPGRSIPDTAGYLPIQWSADADQLYVYRYEELPALVDRIDVKTGKKERWKELMPPSPNGIVAIGPLQITPDGRSYAYTYHRVISELYLVTGLK